MVVMVSGVWNRAQYLIDNRVCVINAAIVSKGKRKGPGDNQEG